jgi:hypothetical protein
MLSPPPCLWKIPRGGSIIALLVCNGLDLKAGDKGLLTDQEHPGGRNPWEQKAARFGVKQKAARFRSLDTH